MVQHLKKNNKKSFFARFIMLSVITLPHFIGGNLNYIKLFKKYLNLIFNGKIKKNQELIIFSE